ncbi:MAG: aldo/keto reductase [Desulfobacterales bacterium]
MLSRNLGRSGISVSAVGLGCMGLSEFYGEPTQESEAIKEIAAQKGCVAAQVALAWVLDHGDHVVVIPGTTQLANLKTNLGALNCRLTEENRATLNELADQVLGDRYSPEGTTAVNH